MSPLIVGSGSSGSEGRSDRLGLPTGTTDPVSSEAGDMYYNTDTSKIRVSDGTAWADLATGGGGGVTGYTIDRSLRFDDANSSYLSRTFSAGNRKTWTLSFWIKFTGKPSTSGQTNIFGVTGGDVFTTHRLFTDSSSSTLIFESANATVKLETQQVFRDYSAWYHIVLAFDTTQDTSSDRQKLYVNGVEAPLATNLAPNQNTDYAVNGAVEHQLGRINFSPARYSNIYLADVHFVDGLALAPTAFGEFDTTTGVWNPIAYSGFGSNPNNNTTWSNNWTASGNGFGSLPPSNAFDGNFTTYMNNDNGGQIVTWNTSSYGLSGSLRIYAYSSSGLYDVYVNGAKAADTGSSAAWIDCGTHGSINEIQFAGTTYNTSDGLGSAGILLAAVEVDGYLLLNSSTDNSFHLDFSDNSNTAALGTDTSGAGNDWSVNNLTASSLYRNAGFTNPANAFDGNTGTFAEVNVTAGLGTIVFTSGISVSSSITIKYGSGTSGNIFINGSATAMQGTGTQTQTISFTGTLNSIGLQSGSQPVLYYVQIDGGSYLTGANAIDVDSLVDTPTNYGTDTGAGGEVRGNYCTWNPLDNVGNTLSNGNLDSLSTAAGISKATIAISSGKWYWEVTKNAGNTSIGIAEATALSSSQYLGVNSQTWSYYSVNGQIYTNGSGVAYGASYGVGDVIGVALDLDNDTLTFYKNGVSQGTAVTGLTSTYVPAVGNDQNGPSVSANFGQRPFAYTAPSGYKALCTSNLPTPTILDGSDYMDVVTWIGDGASPRSFTLNFSPDLIWTKNRSVGYWHNLYDAIRGARVPIHSNVTNGNDTANDGLYGGVSAFNTNGFSVESGTSSSIWANENTQSYVGWAWDAGDVAAVTNTDGTTQSTVKANVDAGFSIVQATISTSSQTLGHGLGVEPAMVIRKKTNNTSNWYVAVKVPGYEGYLLLDSTGTFNSQGTGFTSTVFNAAYTGGTETWINYCFAPIDNYSAFGTYSGNSNADGSFVWTGFRVRWLLIKAIAGSSAPESQLWYLFDSERDSYNLSGSKLFPNNANTENFSQTFANNAVDLLSNGFKCRAANDGTNTGNVYFYAAFAENPFSIARAR